MPRPAWPSGPEHRVLQPKDSTMKELMAHESYYQTILRLPILIADQPSQYDCSTNTYVS